MRRLLAVALLLAGLCAPPAVLAQIGGTPGITPGPITSPVFSGTATFTGTALFGSGTCASTSNVPFTGGVPGIAFSADTDSGLCWDTAGGNAASIGPGFMKDGRQVMRLQRTGGVLMGHNTGGTLKSRSLIWDVLGTQFYGWDATGGAERLHASFSYDDSATPTKGALTLGANMGLAFQGTTADTTLTWITVTNPTGVRTFTIPDFSGTALVSSTANEPDTGNSVWANTGSFLFEGPTANGFETELDVIDPTVDRTIYLPDASGTVITGTQTAASGAAWPAETTISAGDYSGGTSYSVAQTIDGSLGPPVWNLMAFTNMGLSAGISGSHMDENSNPLPQVSIDVSDGGTYSSKLYIRSDGIQQSGLADGARYIPDLASLISGGYTLDGTATSAVADEVDVTLVDTTASVNDGDVQVCGYATSAHELAFGPTTCETLDFSGGAATLTTTATFVKINAIKSSSFAVLGGGGDETLAAAWDADATSIASAANVVNHGASDFTASFPFGIGFRNYASIKCLDLAGCTMGLEAGTQNGQELTLYVRTGSTNCTFADSATMKVSASHTLNEYDTIRFIYTPDTLWAEVSVSTN